MVDIIANRASTLHKYHQKLLDKKESLKMKYETEINKECTFAPVINKYSYT